MSVALLGMVLALANPLVLAHRGGSIQRGAQAYEENTLPAFREAARRGFVLELDVHVTRDEVPVVVHDDTLDRVVAEDCPHRGKPIGQLTLAEIRECFRAPTLEEVLDVAKRHGSTVAPEIKNNPPVEGGPSDFDPSPAFATAVATALRDSGLPQERMIVQSFWPPNLDVAKSILPGAETLFLTLGPLNPGGPAMAAAQGYDWVGPQYPVDGSYVDRAHELGLKVAPYTPNTAEEFAPALASGADGVFTDDPLLLEDTLTLAPLSRSGTFRRVSVARRSAGRCDFVRADGTLAPPRPCRRRLVLRKLTLPAQLPRGRYTLRTGRKRVKLVAQASRSTSRE